MSSAVANARSAENYETRGDNLGREVNATSLDDLAVQNLNEVHAGQAHLYVFSGLPHDWLVDLMQKPAKGEKRKKTLVDVDVLYASGNMQGRLTRKHEFVVEID